MVKICEKANEKDCFWHSETGISKPNEASGLQMVNLQGRKIKTQRLNTPLGALMGYYGHDNRIKNQ